jgi:anti-anti-sigma factor
MAVCSSSPLPLEGVQPVLPLSVVVAEGQGEVVVRLAGEAGVRQVGELSGALLRLSARRPPLVVFDLSALSFISCLALSVLVAFRRSLARAGGRVHMAAALQEPVRQALERAELLALFGLPPGSDRQTPHEVPRETKP